LEPCIALGEQSRNQRTSGTSGGVLRTKSHDLGHAVSCKKHPTLAVERHHPLGRATSHLPSDRATRRSPGGALQLRAGAWRSTPPGPARWYPRPACCCARVRLRPGSTPLFHVAPPPSTPRGLRVKRSVSARGKGRRNSFPQQSVLRRKALQWHVWSVSSAVPSHKPGTSLSTVLPDPPHSCRIAALARKRAAVALTPGPSSLQTGERRMYLGEESGSRGTPPPRTTPRQSPREGVVNRGGGGSVLGDSWVATVSCDAQDGGCLRANRTEVSCG